jgi:branched-chain amino acid transport system ATP-binding protein
MTEELSLVGVTFARDERPVVHDVDLQIKPGRIAAVLGANGAGKSTLVMGIAGVLPVIGGQILLGPDSIAGLRPEIIRRRGIVTLPEGHPVLTELTVLENLRVAGSNLSRRTLARMVAEALEVFPELRAKLNARAGDLSGGQQQMLGLAQAVIAQPRFLLADELSFGLAPLIVRRLVSVLSRLAESGVGILLIEQFTQVALGISQHAYVLDRGQIRFSGSPDVLRERPEILHQAYLASGDTASTREKRA